MKGKIKMDNKVKGFFGCSGALVSCLGFAVSPEDLDHIVSIICAGIGLLITIVCVVVIPFIQWIKRSKADGKITAEELGELKDTLQDGKEAIEKEKEKNK